MRFKITTNQEQHPASSPVTIAGDDPPTPSMASMFLPLAPQRCRAPPAGEGGAMNPDQRTRRAGEGGSVNSRRGRLEDDWILASQGCCDGRLEAQSQQQTPQLLCLLEDEAALPPAV
jgi:hypothetical protein